MRRILSAHSPGKPRSFPAPIDTRSSMPDYPVPVQSGSPAVPDDQHLRLAFLRPNPPSQLHFHHLPQSSTRKRSSIPQTKNRKSHADQTWLRPHHLNPDAAIFEAVYQKPGVNRASSAKTLREIAPSVHQTIARSMLRIGPAASVGDSIRVDYHQSTNHRGADLDLPVLPLPSGLPSEICCHLDTTEVQKDNASLGRGLGLNHLLTLHSLNAGRRWVLEDRTNPAASDSQWRFANSRAVGLLAQALHPGGDAGRV